MRKRKIIRRSFTVDFLKMFAGKQGCEKTIVKENRLPEDAYLIHLDFSPESNLIDMFFISDKEGQEVLEGGSIYSVEPSLVIMETIPTIDESKIKETIKKHTLEIMNDTGSPMDVIYPEDLLKALGLE